MNKRIILGLLLVTAVSGMVFFGCDIFSDMTSGGDSSAYEPLIIRGRAITGENVEIEISTKRTRSRVVLTPENGDSYELRLDGKVTSRGTIQINETNIIFNP